MKQKLRHFLQPHFATEMQYTQRIWILDRQIYCKCFNQNIRPTNCRFGALKHGGDCCWSRRNGALIIHAITVGQFRAPTGASTDLQIQVLLTSIWHNFAFYGFWTSIFEHFRGLQAFYVEPVQVGAGIQTRPNNNVCCNVQQRQH